MPHYGQPKLKELTHAAGIEYTPIYRIFDCKTYPPALDYIPQPFFSTFINASGLLHLIDQLYRRDYAFLTLDEPLDRRLNFLCSHRHLPQ